MSENPDTQTRAKRFLYKALTLFIAIFCLPFVVLTVLTLFGSATRQLELLTHLRIQIMVPLLIALPILLLRRSKILLSLVAIALFINVFDLVPLYLTHSAATSKSTIHLLSMNLNTSNRNFRAVQDVIKKQNADVVCLQELSPAIYGAIGENLPEYPFKFVEPSDGYFGIGIFSKYALENKQTLMLCNDAIPTLSATINFHGANIRLVNTHPIAPLNDSYYASRNQQLDALATLSAKSPTPLIVAGDLNTTYFSPFFKRLLHNGQLTDSEFGFGVQPSWSAQTWPLNAPFDCVLFRLPLDHVLTRGDIFTIDRKLLPDIGSDHLPLSVELGLPLGK